MRDAFGRDAGHPGRRRVRLMWVAAVALLAAGVAGALAIASVNRSWELVAAPAVLAGIAGGAILRRALAVGDDAVAIVVPHPQRVGAALTLAAGLLAGGGLLALDARRGAALLVALAAADGTRWRRQSCASPRRSRRDSRSISTRPTACATRACAASSRAGCS